MKILGPWVAIQPVEAMMVGGGLLLKPWSARQPDCFIAEVLALGDGIHDAPFGVGDFLLVEQMSGHPAMATDWPDIVRPDGKRLPGRTRPVDIPASELGGDPGKPLGLLRYLPTDKLKPCAWQDEEATRRMERAGMLTKAAQTRSKTFGEEPDAAVLEEIGQHTRWLKEHEVRREGQRRSRLMKPHADPGQGDGVVAVIEDAEDLLAMGVSAEWLAGRLVAQGVVL